MPSRNIYIAAGIFCSTASMFGYHRFNWRTSRPFNHYFGLDGLSKHDKATTQSVIVSIWLLGSLFGVIGAMPMCSHFGRRKCLLSSFPPPLHMSLERSN